MSSRDADDQLSSKHRKHEVVTRTNKLLYTGIAGTTIAALCCFTPVLVVLFGVIGLSALVGYLDYVLLPALAFFIGLTIYAVWRRRQCVDHG